MSLHNKYITINYTWKRQSVLSNLANGLVETHNKLIGNAVIV